MFRFDRTFRTVAGRTSLGLALVGSAAVATLSATNPAAAAAALEALQNAVTCNSTSACYLATNSSTGPGVAGTSTKGVGMQGKGVYGVKGLATTNYGVLGSSTSGLAGVAGTTASAYGVYGYTTGSGTGVFGSSSNSYGVYGTTSTATGYGVVGNLGGSGIGTYGGSSSGTGLEGKSSSGYALYADAYGSGSGGYFSADGGGYGLISYSAGNVAIYGQNSSGNGADIRGTYIGITARAPALNNTFPIVATDSNGSDLFYVDGVGNVYYHGGLISFARVPGGALVKSFSPSTTAPTVEDTGTAQLVAGAATVRLDPTFAASVDAASSYRVFVTPNGDTHGLFVATKTASGFIVRESQGGRSTVSFDYRIVATAAGKAGQRMAVANAALEPHGTAPLAPHFTSATIAPAPQR